MSDKIDKLETKVGGLKDILEDSTFARLFLGIIGSLRARVTGYTKTSFIVKWINNFKDELYALPVKVLSIIIIIVILSDTLFCFLIGNVMQNGIQFFGWVLKILLLFAGLAGLSCKSGLEDLISTSLFLKLIKKLTG